MEFKEFDLLDAFKGAQLILHHLLDLRVVSDISHMIHNDHDTINEAIGILRQIKTIVEFINVFDESSSIDDISIKDLQ
jgi:hypothetical protein